MQSRNISDNTASNNTQVFTIALYTILYNQVNRCNKEDAVV